MTERNDALTLEKGVFTKPMARSLKRSAERSDRRKSSAYHSATSMLTLYINRAGRDLPKSRKAKLENAKDQLRELYGKSKQAKRKNRN